MRKAWKPAYLETVRDSDIGVVEPTQSTEFEVQAFLWSSLRAIGVNARGEVRCRFSGRAQVRFDVAVFEGGRLVGLIECKRDGRRFDSDWSSTRQGTRYFQFGVPVRLVTGMDEAKQAVEDAMNGALWQAAANQERAA